MPDGAALVFDYTLAGSGDPPDAWVYLWDLFTALEPTDERRTRRECVRLDELPRIGTLAFLIEQLGVCMPATASEWHLHVDNVRLEPDASCD